MLACGPPSFVNNSRNKSPFPWDSAPGADTDGEEDDPAYTPPHVLFPISQRLPSRAGAPRHVPVPALAATIDPRGHRQAMKAPKAEEWRAAELAELQNHTANGSFHEMNRVDARRLADSHGADFNVTGCLWVYKTKRDCWRVGWTPLCTGAPRGVVPPCGPPAVLCAPLWWACAPCAAPPCGGLLPRVLVPPCGVVAPTETVAMTAERLQR